MQSTLYFEQAFIPARSIALTELLDLYFQYNPKTSKSDTYLIKQAFRILLGLFPDDQPKPDTATFKIGYFDKFQKHLIDLGYAIIQINRLFAAVKRVFKWGGKPRFDQKTSDQIPPIVTSEFLVGMNAIDLIDEGKINPERQEVPVEVVTAVFPYVTKTIADILRLQLLTGMRPKEACTMCVSNIKRTKEEISKYYLFDDDLFDENIWLYVLPNHKTKKYIGTKIVPIGLQEQEILAKYLNNCPVDSFLFRNQFGKPMTRNCYDDNIQKAIEKNGLQKFIPHQIRHTVITKISLKHNLDIARAIAGHTTEVMTARYDHSDLKKTIMVVRERNKEFIIQKKIAGDIDVNGNMPF
jgi:integrase